MSSSIYLSVFHIANGQTNNIRIYRSASHTINVDISNHTLCQCQYNFYLMLPYLQCLAKLSKLRCNPISGAAGMHPIQHQLLVLGWAGVLDTIIQHLQGNRIGSLDVSCREFSNLH